MRRLISLPLVLILAALIHVDWHFARPLHHRLSLDWSSHWLFGIAFFAAAGWYIAKRWPSAPWRATIWNVTLALIAAQVIEPVLEAAYYTHQLGYPVETERWAAFRQCIGAALPALAITMWWFRDRRGSIGSAQQAAAAGGGAAGKS